MPYVDLPPAPPAKVRRCQRPVCAPIPVAAQLLPNLTIGIDRHGAAPGGRLRLTPFLLALGMVGGPRVRAFAVEPLERNAGSLELVVQGEIYRAAGYRAHTLGLVRSLIVGTFGLRERGEQLSLSLGMGVAYDFVRPAVSVEAGLYTFSGIFGLTVSSSPLERGPPTVITLVCKFF